MRVAPFGQPHDVELVLADADRLDDHRLLAEGGHQPGDMAGGAGQAADVAAGAEAADEDRVIEVVGLHADAVAEHGTAGERAGGVDRHHADSLAGAAQRADQAIHQGRLAGPRRSGDPDHPHLGAVAVQPAGGVRLAVLDQRHQLGQRDAVARQHTLDERRRPFGHQAVVLA
jgi:hypothetical protein